MIKVQQAMPNKTNYKPAFGDHFGLDQHVKAPFPSECDEYIEDYVFKIDGESVMAKIGSNLTNGFKSIFKTKEGLTRRFWMNLFGNIK